MRQLLTAAMLTSLLATTGCSKLGWPGRAVPTVTSAHLRTAAADPARVVIGLKAGASAAAIARRHGLTTALSLPALGAAVLAAPVGKAATGQLAALLADAGVAYAEPDYLVRLADAPTATAGAAPSLSRQWGVTKIDAPRAWSLGQGSADVTVAILDTGVDLTHPDLRANLVPGMTMFPEQGGPVDMNGHGTHVAGIVAGLAAGPGGTTGIAPGCKLMPVKVMGPTGPEGKVENVAAGLVWAVDHGAKIVNMSLGDEGTSTLLRDAVLYAQRKDVLVVAATGNTDENHPNPNTLDYPAGYSGVLSVGATDEQDQLADFSFWGTWISVVAPGVDILSTWPGAEDVDAAGGNHHMEDGTSMATPMVAGVAALVRSRYPQLSAQDVKRRIERTAVDLGPAGYDDHFGYGRVDAFRAVTAD